MSTMRLICNKQLKQLITLIICLTLTMNLSAQDSIQVSNVKITLNSTPDEVYKFVSQLNAKQNQRITKRSEYSYRLDSLLYSVDGGCFQAKRSFFHDTIYPTNQIREVELDEGCSTELPNTWLPGLFFVRHYDIKSERLDRESVNYWKSSLSSRWDESFATILREYIYDEEGRLERYNLSTFNEQERPPLYHFYDYDSLGLLERVKVFRNDTTNLEGIFWYTHTEEGLLESIVRHYLRPSDIIEPADSTVYKYIDSGQLEEETVYVWFNPFYGTNYRNLHEYNDEGLLITKYFYEGHFSLHTQEESKYYYNEDGSLDIINVFDVSDDDYSRFLENYAFTYDHNVSGDLILFPKSFSYRHGAPQIKMLLKYEEADFGLEERFDVDYFYSSLETSSSTSITYDSNFSIFPNPVSDKLIVDYDTSLGLVDLTIYNTKGTVIKEYKNVSSAQKFDVSMFETGIYFIRIAGRNNVDSVKFVKK